MSDHASRTLRAFPPNALDAQPALVLCGAEVKEETTDDWPWGEATREEFEA